MSRFELYTDGACVGNPGPGGWAFVLKDGAAVKEGFGRDEASTNNRMEMTAVIRGLEAVGNTPSRIRLTSDSRYVLDGCQKWLRGWKRNGWVTRGREEVKNRDLWERLDYLLAIHQVIYVWVRGHSGHPDNERCDALATAAAEGRTAPERVSDDFVNVPMSEAAAFKLRQLAAGRGVPFGAFVTAYVIHALDADDIQACERFQHRVDRALGLTGASNGR